MTAFQKPFGGISFRGHRISLAVCCPKQKLILLKSLVRWAYAEHLLELCLNQCFEVFFQIGL